MEQSALVDEALARIQEAERAVRLLKISGSTDKTQDCMQPPSQVEKNSVAQTAQAEENLTPPPDAVITESSEMQMRVKDDVVVIRKSVIWTHLGVVKLPFLHPECNARLCWLMLGMAFTFMDSILIPYTLAFGVQAEGTGLRWVMDIYFLADILVTFFTGFLDAWGVCVVRPVHVWRRYLTSWFFFDVLAAFPWQLCGITGVSRLTRNIRVVRALRIARIVRVVKLKYLKEKLEPYLEGNQAHFFAIAILEVLATLFMVCHWCSCLWFSSVSGSTDLTWISHLPDGVQELDPVEHHSDLYLWSLYFTMTTMTTVGFGDITPTNTTEAHYCIMFLGISAIVFAGQLGVLSDIISNMNTRAKAKREQKATLARYMKWRIVPKELRASIRQHCLFLWEKNEGNDAYEDTLKDFLPPVLRQELCFHIYGSVLQNAPFLVWMAEFPTVVKFLANAVENSFWSRGDFIFRYDNLNESITLLLTGQVRLSKNERIVQVPISDLSLPMQDRFYVPNKNVKKVKIDDGAPTIKKAMAKRLFKSATKRNLESQSDNSPTRIQQPQLNATLANGHRIAPADDAIDPIFQSEMFISSWRRLAQEDENQVQAARMLQCKWRKRRKRMEEKNHGDDGSRKWNNRTGPKSLKSYSIKAPAFFGESCLWQARLDASFAKPYGYSAQCEGLCETLAIETKHIEDLLERFSPWLQERFDRFKEEVITLHALRTGDIVVDRRPPDCAKSSGKWARELNANRLLDEFTDEVAERVDRMLPPSDGQVSHKPLPHSAAEDCSQSVPENPDEPQPDLRELACDVEGKVKQPVAPSPMHHMQPPMPPQELHPFAP